MERDGARRRVLLAMSLSKCRARALVHYRSWRGVPKEDAARTVSQVQRPIDERALKGGLDAEAKGTRRCAALGTCGVTGKAACIVGDELEQVQSAGTRAAQPLRCQGAMERCWRKEDVVRTPLHRCSDWCISALRAEGELGAEAKGTRRCAALGTCGVMGSGWVNVNRGGNADMIFETLFERECKTSKRRRKHSENRVLSFKHVRKSCRHFLH